MDKIDFGQKIRPIRPYGKSNFENLDDYRLNAFFESDRGRILNSAAIRRLQQKTQVFPLERNASVRSRLTHSLEVQQVGRYIAKEILQRLKCQNKITEYGLSSLEAPFESLVEMACLMHDIGNPPFGHFGEAAINNWFEKQLASDNEVCQSNRGENRYFSKLADCELKQKIRADLCHFDGNAQGIRLVHSIQQLNLTYSQIATILKYTRPAYMAGENVDECRNYLMKKAGFYLSEESYIESLWQQLNMAPYSRHPLTYIMEAADDISYCLADLEDAVEKSIFTIEELVNYLKIEWGNSVGNTIFERIVMLAQEKVALGKSHRNKNDQFFMTLRIETIRELVNYVAEQFIQNLPAIFAGRYNQPILNNDSENEVCRLLACYKRLALKHVFSHEEVEQRELQGYRILTGLLEIYQPLLSIDECDFRTIAEQDIQKGFIIETHLYNKLSDKHKLAYKKAVQHYRNTFPQNEYVFWEFYARCRLIQDYISGMTDHYAYDEYQKLTAMTL